MNPGKQTPNRIWSFPRSILSLAPWMAVWLCISLPIHADYVSTLASQNPDAWYRMEDASDEEGGANLTANTVVLGVASASGSGATFIPDQGTLAGLSGGWSTYAGQGGDTVTDLYLPSTAAGSVSFWASKATGLASSTSTTLMASLGGTNFDGVDPSMIAGFIRNDGSAGFRFHDPNGSVIQLDMGAGTTSMNTWNHWAYTWDRGSGAADGVVRMYLNGAMIAEGTGLSWDAFTIDRARWGKETSGTRYFGGGMDELAFWDRAITAGEVSQQFFASQVPEPASFGLLITGWILLGFRRFRSN